MSLRVLFAIHGPANPFTAVYRSVSQRVEHLRRAGHDVDLLTADDLRWSTSRLDPLLLPAALAIRGVGRYDAAVFHSYLGWAFHLARPWLDPSHRVATVTSFHGLEPLYHEALSQELARDGRRLSVRFRLLHGTVLTPLLRTSCRRSDAVFCLNRAEVAYVTGHGWAEPDRVHCLANGVEPECFMPPGRPAARRLLFIGQWLPAKGTRYLIDAWTALCERHDLELACVGTGAPADAVLASFPEHVRGRVTVRPRVTRAELADELTRADLFVFPSLSEGFSNALLEAMAAGLPIVATDAGAAADLLRGGDNGLVVPRADAGALVTAVDRLVGDPALRARLAGSARDSAEAYALDRVNVQFLDHLLEVIDRRAVSPGRAWSRGSDVVG